MQTLAQRNWWIRNKDKRKQKILEMKQLIFSHYGNICACCGEQNKKFLTIDHVNNDDYIVEKSGHTRLAGTTIYPKVIRLGFPQTFQLLCWNCNCGKAYNKNVCPHKDEAKA